MNKPFICPICCENNWKKKKSIDSNIKHVPPGLTRPNSINCNICECASCGLEFNKDFLHNKNYRALYTDQMIYSQNSHSHPYTIEPLYSFDIIHALNRFSKEKGNLLEIGFQNINVLEQFKASGWKVEGVDLDSSAVKRAQNKGYTTYQSDIEDKIFDQKRYDAIVAIGVFEHIENPLRFLLRINELLNSNGLLLLQLPNPQSLNAFCSKFSIHGWDMYGEPGHVFLYRKSHLITLLKRYCFSIKLYHTATIRSRGKIPFIPFRNHYLETKMRFFIQQSNFILACYTALLKLLDFFSLGDTHIIIAQKVKV